MNKTALSVIALAVGAVLILGLYNVYKPQTNHLVGQVFSKINRRLDRSTINYICNGKTVGTQSVKPDSTTPVSDLKIPEGYVFHHSHSISVNGINDSADVKVDKAKNQNISKKTGSFENVNYIDDGCGHITFTNGAIYGHNDNLLGWTAPSDLRNATSVKFDNVDITHTNSIHNLLSVNHNIRSIDLGNNFNTKNIDDSEYGIDGMFEGDTNLQYLNLGNKFYSNKNRPGKFGFAHVFNQDDKLKRIDGGNPSRQRIINAFKHRKSHIDED